MSFTYEDGFLPWVINDYQKEIVAAPAGTQYLPDLFPMKIEDICKIYWLAKRASLSVDYVFDSGDGTCSSSNIVPITTPDVPSRMNPSPSELGVSLAGLVNYGGSFGGNSAPVDFGPAGMPNPLFDPSLSPSDPGYQPPFVAAVPPYDLIIPGGLLVFNVVGGPSPADGWNLGGGSASLFIQNRYLVGGFGGMTSFDQASGLFYLRALMDIQETDNTIGIDTNGGYFERPQGGAGGTEVVTTYAQYPGHTPIPPPGMGVPPHLEIQISGTKVGSAPLYGDGVVSGTFVLNFDQFWA